LNRKYRVLDDCARLRDIVDALSSKRHYALSLLILRWVNEEPQDKDKDKAVVVNDEFLNMVRLSFFFISSGWFMYTAFF